MFRIDAYLVFTCRPLERLGLGSLVQSLCLMSLQKNVMRTTWIECSQVGSLENGDVNLGSWIYIIRRDKSLFREGSSPDEHSKWRSLYRVLTSHITIKVVW